MPIFSYTGVNQSGAVVQSSVEASNSDAARSRLAGEGVTVVALSEKRLRSQGFGRKHRISQSDVAWMARMLAATQDSGVEITDAILMLATDRKGTALGNRLDDIYRDITGEGITLADALKKYEDDFGSAPWTMVQAGLRGAGMANALRRLAAQLEKQIKLRRSVTTAALSPAITLITSVLVFALLIIFLVPRFKTIYASFDAELPLPTQVVVSIYDVLLKGCWYPIAGPVGLPILPIAIVVLCVWVSRSLKKPGNAYILDALKLRIPVLAPILRMVIEARVTSTLSNLFKTGATTTEALLLAATVSGNKVYESELRKALTLIEEKGLSLDQAMKGKHWAPMLVSFVAIGNRGGKLPEMLGDYSKMCEEELDVRIMRLEQAMPHALTILMAAIVIPLIVALYLPILNLTQVVQ